MAKTAFKPFLLSSFKLGWNEQFFLLIITPRYLNSFTFSILVFFNLKVNFSVWFPLVNVMHFVFYN